MNKKILKSIILFSIIFLCSFNFVDNFSELNYNENAQPEIVPGVVVLKLKSTTSAHGLAKGGSAIGISSLDSKLQKHHVLSVEKMFKHKPIPENSNLPDISRIIKAQIPEDVNPLTVIKELSNDPNIEYAEPVYKRYFFEVPNDPKYPQQDHLRKIKAPEAWDIQKGDSNIVIAIIDSGFDLEHEDLKENVWINKSELNGIAGVDDDGNGFIDDIHGWDFGSKDNDPAIDPNSGYTYSHGTAMAGIACAVSDNGIGVSGVSWNCKFMSIKISNNEDFFAETGFEGMIYAADNGVDIISNSWGGDGYSQWEQDIINYVHNKGCIVVCAAGNEGGDNPVYPQAYQNAISVAAIDDKDEKIYYSNYGPFVDICTPSSDFINYFTLLTTYPENQYRTSGGTSGACPLAAGVFGLVKSMHPDWSNDQVISQVLLSAEDLNLKNPSYVNQLGHGKINAYRALTLTDLPQPDARISVFKVELSDSAFGDNDNVFEIGETISLKTMLRNYSIGSTNTASLILTISNPNIEIINGSYRGVYFPADTTLPFDFSFRINSVTNSQQIKFKLSIQTDMGYSREETIPVILGSTPVLVLDHDNGWYQVPHTNVEEFYLDIIDQKKISFTYWDCSKFGLPSNDFLKNFPIIILFKEVTGYGRFLSESREKIKNYLISGGNLFISGPDIGYTLFVKHTIPETKEFMRKYLHSEYVANRSSNRSVFGVEGDPITDSLSFDLWQPLFSADMQSPDVIIPTEGAASIFEYRSGEIGAVKYSGSHKLVYMGFGLESVDSDAGTQMGDMSPIRTEVLMRSLNWLNFIEHKPLSDVEDFSSSQEVVVAVRPISPEVKSVTLNWRLKGEENFNSLPMIKVDSVFSSEIPGQNQSETIEYYIETEFKYYTWTNPISAPMNLYSYKVGSITNIENDNSKLPKVFSLSQNYPNPFNPSTTIKYSIPTPPTSSPLVKGRTEVGFVTLKVYDILGREVATLVNENQKPGYYKVKFDANDLTSGVYFYKLAAGEFVETKKMILLR